LVGFTIPCGTVINRISDAGARRLGGFACGSVLRRIVGNSGTSALIGLVFSGVLVPEISRIGITVVCYVTGYLFVGYICFSLFPFQMGTSGVDTIFLMGGVQVSDPNALGVLNSCGILIFT